jgi:hypothetical protein
MDPEREYRSGGRRVPLPQWEDPAAAQRAAPATARENGTRQLRRMSAWSAAALVVGTGAATAAFAHGFTPAAPVASPTTAAGIGGGTVSAGGAAAHGGGGPAVTHSVATTSGSGVTTVTTTRTSGGRTVVTRVRQGGGYQDN